MRDDRYVAEMLDSSTLDSVVRCDSLLYRRSMGGYICKRAGEIVQNCFPLHHSSLFMISLTISFVYTFSFRYTFQKIPLSISSYNANDDHVDLAALSTRVKDNVLVADENAVIRTEVCDTEIDRGVPSWSVAEYQTRFADTLDTRWCHAMFSDSTDLFMFDRRNVRRNTNLGALARRWTLLRR